MVETWVLFPFVVALSGFIKNTEKLSYGKEHMYKLTVTAYDCGKNRASEDVLVKISIKPTCRPSWQGMKVKLSILFYNSTQIITLISQFSFSLGFQASIRGLSMNRAPVAWLFSPACTWRPAMCPSPLSGPVLNWKPTTSERAVTVTRTLRSHCTSCVVNK